MLKARLIPYRLLFKEAAITSRDTMTSKETFFIELTDTENPAMYGLGEVPLFRGLSAEDTPDFVRIVSDFCNDFNLDNIPNLSSLRFGIESALAYMKYRENPLQTDFSHKINGLIWMGDKKTMFNRICSKLDLGFRCIKLKIGGIDFEQEVDLLKFIRSKFSPDTLELRLDANGSFSVENALERLNCLSRFGIHSLEQPIKAGQLDAMAEIVRQSPIPIALDEELIGVSTCGHIANVLDLIKPHYIILKPALCGGFKAAEQWISEASKRNIGWWATSALESNVGLTAIALWLNTLRTSMPQGLGTGALYLNNFQSPLHLEADNLIFDHTKPLPSLGCKES